MALLKEYICASPSMQRRACTWAGVCVYLPEPLRSVGLSSVLHAAIKGPLHRVASAFVVGALATVFAARPQLSLAQSPPYQSRTRNRDSDVKRLAQSAAILLKNGEYAKAAMQYQDILRLDPSYREAYFFLGACYSQTSDFAKAEKSLRAYLALEPRSSDGHTTLGLVLARTGRTSEARRELNQAFTMDPTQDVARVELARLDLVVQDYAQAVNLLQSWIPSHPSEFDALAVLIEAKIGKRDYADAITSINRLISMAPRKHPQFYVMLGYCWKSLGETGKALDAYERGMEAFPSWTPLEESYLSLLSNSGQFYSVINERSQRLKAAPNDVDQLIALGSLLAATDEGTKPPSKEISASLLERALQLAPDNALAHYNYCRLQIFLMKYDLARAECQRALTLPADDRLKIAAYSELGVVEEQLSHYDAAESAFHSAVQLNHKVSVHDLDAYYDFINYLMNQSRDAEARMLIDEALGWAPASAPLLMERAEVLAREGQWQEAVESAELALAHVGDDKQTERAAHMFLARTYFKLKQPDKAQIHEQWFNAQ